MASGRYGPIPAAQVLEFGAYGVAAFDPKRPLIDSKYLGNRSFSRYDPITDRAMG